MTMDGEMDATSTICITLICLLRSDDAICNLIILQTTAKTTTSYGFP